MVITDHLSKWAIAVPMAEITTKVITEVLVNRVILEGNGTPTKILTDRASNFNSELAQEIYELLNISKKTTSAYHLQCDGHTERFNDTLCRTLAKLLQEHALEWDGLLQTKQKQLHDGKVHHVEYEKRDLVWIENMTKPPPGTSSKFQDKYLGLYVIKKKTGPSNYIVGGNGLKEQVVHVT